MSHLRSILVLGWPVGPRLALAAVLGVGAAGTAVALTLTSAWLIARAAEQPPVFTLLVAVTAVRTFGIARGVFRYVERLAAHDAAFRVLAGLRGTVYAHLARIAPAGLGELRSGDLLARLVGDVDGLADIWLRVGLPYLAAAVVSIATVVFIGLLVPLAGLVLAVTLLVTATLAPLAAGAAARHAESVVSPLRGALAAATVEVLEGAAELVAADATDRATAPGRRLARELWVAEGRASAGAGVTTLVSGLSSGAAVWIALLAGIAAVQTGSLPGVLLALVALAPVAAHEVVTPLAPAARLLPALSASASRVQAILRRPEPVADPPAPEAIPVGPLGLRAAGLVLGYSARPDAATTRVVGPLDFDVAPGGRLVITGPSGSGKSTLAAACLRFLEPMAGTIALVGEEGDAGIPQVVLMTQLTGASVRSAVCVCAQDAHVFDATIADNLRLARPGATAEDLLRAARRAGLEPWIASLPDGLRTPVGWHGAALSGGQRQRLALARALLADARILVLDEPTEHLDEVAARALVADIEAAAAGRTVVVLTHRPGLFPAPSWDRGPDLGAAGGDGPEV